MSNRCRFQLPPAPRTQVNMNFNFNYSASDWQVPVSSEHPFVDLIRKAVLKYRIQSAPHFSVAIEVAQVIHAQNPPRSYLLQANSLYVGFYNFGTTAVIALCRPRSLLNGKKQVNLSCNNVEVFVQNKFVPLTHFLNMKFPEYNVPVGNEVMYQWWKANGKKFNWTGLPTELKERIIQFCMHRSALPPLSKRSIYKDRGPHEVTMHLGEWAPLLRVSHQVRAISLRLCLTGSSDLRHDKGLCIISQSSIDFNRAIRRLSKFPQLLEADNASIATDEKTLMFVDTYKHFPKIYPHLQRFATLGHGIRKVSLQLSFLDALHFFRVDTAGLAQYRHPYHLHYDVFERLPYLNELWIYLPDKRDRLMDVPRQPGPLIFGDEPCPRILHRLVYERAAEVLAKYPFVTLVGFMDEMEKSRYTALRKEAIKGLNFSEKELEDMYMEEGGGVQLEEIVWPGVDKEDDDQVGRAIVFDSFWPPQCKCDVLCRNII